MSARSIVAAALLLAGCASTSVPPDALRLEESTLDVRSIQTRGFAAPSELDILAATIAVLQDMEFNIDRIEKPLGVITASKVSDADNSTEKSTGRMLDILCTASRSGDCRHSSTARDEQRITLTMVVLPSLARNQEFVTRITIQRVILDKENRIKVLERIDDAEIYQEIFANLTKAVYRQGRQK